MPSKPYSQVAILLSRVGKRGIEPPMFTTWELIYSQPQHRQSLPLPHNRHPTVSNNVFRAMRCTIQFTAFHWQLIVVVLAPWDRCQNHWKLYGLCAHKFWNPKFQHHIDLHQIPLSAVNATGRSRTALNRIVLVGKGCVMKNTKKENLRNGSLNPFLHRNGRTWTCGYQFTRA